MRLLQRRHKLMRPTTKDALIELVRWSRVTWREMPAISARLSLRRGAGHAARNQFHRTTISAAML